MKLSSSINQPIKSIRGEKEKIQKQEYINAVLVLSLTLKLHITDLTVFGTGDINDFYYEL